MVIEPNTYAEGFVDGWQSVLGKDERPSLIPEFVVSLGGKSDYRRGYEYGRLLAGRN
jgi:hypothetical protein